MKLRRVHFESYAKPGQSYSYIRKNLATADRSFLHDHDCYELFLVERGSAYHFINGEKQYLEPGSLVFIRPTDQHAFRAKKSSGCKLVNIMIPKASVEFIFAHYGEDFQNQFFWKDGLRPDMYVLFGKKFDRTLSNFFELNSSSKTRALIEGALLNTMTRIINDDLKTMNSIPIWLNRACQAAKQPEVFKLGAKGFVNISGRGHEHVCRAMKQHLGETPSSFINQIRIERAATLLTEDEFTISEICDEIGLENLSYFYKLFTEQYGVTPAKFRSSHRQIPF